MAGRMSLETHPVTRQVIGCAIEVHRHIGPGLLESVYEKCLAHEFAAAKIAFRRQVDVPLLYKGTPIECGFRIDLLVDSDLIVEVKSVEQVHPVHAAQVITYLKLTGARQALLLNFRVPRMKDGIKSFIRTGEQCSQAADD
jgi:GxxExxY protein